MNKVLFIKNTVLITIISFALRFLGIILHIFMTHTIGAEGIGLYQLIFSVYTLASTFSTAGVSAAVIKLISSELIKGSTTSLKTTLKKCTILSLSLGLIAMITIFTFSSFIGKYWLNDIRSINALRILVFAFPFMSITSCLKGYFIARNKASIPSFAQLIEQIVRISLIFLLIKNLPTQNIETACFIIMFGDALSEITSCLFSYFVYKKDIKRIKIYGTQKSIFSCKEFFKVSIPIASNRYINSILRTIESILIPLCLNKYYSSSQDALEIFGMIRGMALPLVFFPSAILSSISNMLIPEITTSKELHHTKSIAHVTKKICKISVIFSTITAMLLYYFGNELGAIIYHNEEVGRLIKCISIAVPFMYLEMIIMGIMQGLDQQSKCLKYNIINSIIRIILIYFIVPIKGINSFLIILILSNIYTSSITAYRLFKIIKNPKKYLK